MQSLNDLQLDSNDEAAEQFKARKASRTEYLRDNLIDVLWQVLQREGILKFTQDVTADDYLMLRKLAAEATKPVNNKVTSLEKEFTNFRTKQDETLKQILVNQGTMLAAIANLSTSMSTTVDQKIQEAEARIFKSFGDFEAKIQGHLKPVENLASSDSIVGLGTKMDTLAISISDLPSYLPSSTSISNSFDTSMNSFVTSSNTTICDMKSTILAQLPDVPSLYEIQKAIADSGYAKASEVTALSDKVDNLPSSSTINACFLDANEAMLAQMKSPPSIEEIQNTINNSGLAKASDLTTLPSSLPSSKEIFEIVIATEKAILAHLPDNLELEDVKKTVDDVVGQSVGHIMEEFKSTAKSLEHICTTVDSINDDFTSLPSNLPSLNDISASVTASQDLILKDLAMKPTLNEMSESQTHLATADALDQVKSQINSLPTILPSSDSISSLEKSIELYSKTISANTDTKLKHVTKVTDDFGLDIAVLQESLGAKLGKEETKTLLIDMLAPLAKTSEITTLQSSISRLPIGEKPEETFNVLFRNMNSILNTLTGHLHGHPGGACRICKKDPLDPLVTSSSLLYSLEDMQRHFHGEECDSCHPGPLPRLATSKEAQDLSGNLLSLELAFESMNRQLLDAVKEAVRMALKEHSLWGPGMGNGNGSTTEDDDDETLHAHPNQNLHMPSDGPIRSSSPRHTPPPKEYPATTDNEKTNFHLDDTIRSQNSSFNSNLVPLAELVESTIAGKKHPRPETSNTDTSSSLVVRTKKPRVTDQPIMQWLEVDIGPPASKNCKMDEKLKNSGLPEEICQQIHKVDQKQSLGHRVFNAEINKETLCLCWLSATNPPPKDWEFAAAEPRLKGKRSETFTRHQADWWKQIWDKTSEICPKCKFSKEIGKNIACFYFTSNTTIKMLVESSGGDAEEEIVAEKGRSVEEGEGGEEDLYGGD